MVKQQAGFGILGYFIWGTAILAAAYGLFQWLDNNWITDAGISKGEANIQAKWDKAKQDQRDKEIEKGKQAAANLGANDAKAQTIYRDIIRNVNTYIDRPVYLDQCFDDDGLRDANRALRGEGAPAGKPDAPLRKAGTTG